MTTTEAQVVANFVIGFVICFAAAYVIVSVIFGR